MIDVTHLPERIVEVTPLGENGPNMGAGLCCRFALQMEGGRVRSVRKLGCAITGDHCTPAEV